MIENSSNLSTQNQFKRFLKKEIFLQSSLNFYLNWREIKDYSLTNESSIKFSREINLSSKNLNFKKNSNLVSKNNFENTAGMEMQNIKALKNFATPQKQTSSNFQKSHSYWLFPLFALIGSANSELTKPYFPNVNQLFMINKGASTAGTLQSNSTLFDGNEIEIPVYLNTSVTSQASSPGSNLHLDLKQKLLNQYLTNSIWKLHWWKFNMNSTASPSTRSLISFQASVPKFQESKLSQNTLDLQNFHEKTAQLPIKLSPFKNMLQNGMDINSQNTINIFNINQTKALQPIQSYLQASLLYDSLFFETNSTLKTTEVNSESQSFLLYLKELKKAEFWKNYFQAYLDKMNLQENSEKIDNLISNTTLFEKILFSDEPQINSTNFNKTIPQTSAEFQNSLKKTLLNEVFESFQTVSALSTQKMDFNLMNQMINVFIGKSENFNSNSLNYLKLKNNVSFDQETFFKQNFASNLPIFNAFLTSNSDQVLMNETLKLKTPILQNTQKYNFDLVNEQLNLQELNQNKEANSNSLIKIKVPFRNYASSDMLPYFSLPKHSLGKEWSNEIQKIGLNLNLTLHGKLKNLVWVRSKLLNLLSQNWTTKNSNLKFHQSQKILNSPKKLRKIEKILRSYLSIKKISGDSSNLVTKTGPETSKTVLRLNRNSTKLWNKKLANEQGQKQQKFQLNVNQLNKLKIQLKENFQQKNTLKTQISSGQNIKKLNDIKILEEKLTPQSLIVKKGLVFISRSSKENLSNLNRIEKIKTQQKQRRRKKQRRENRRRKKRKRFFPRPVWLRFSFYKKFLAKRHSKPIQLESSLNKILKPLKSDTTLNSISSLFLSETNGRNLKKNFKKTPVRDGNTFRLKIYRTNRQFTLPAQEKNNLKSQKLFSSLPVFGENRFFYIPKFIIADFQRSLLKSYWLKANLKPYLTRIQNSLDEINSNEKEFNFLLSFKNLFYSFLKIDSNLNSAQFELNTNNFSNLEFDSTNRENSIFSLETLIYPNSNFLENSKLTTNSFDKIEENDLIGLPPSLNAKLINLSEYNQILYKRILSFIKNIKMNLNTNGNIRPHPFHEGRSKPQKIEMHNIWNRLNQILNFEFFSSSLDSPKLVKNLRMIWSMNKTNVFAFKDQNELQKIWNFSKYRDQKKSNKTRLLLNKLSRFLSFQTNKEQTIEVSKLTNVVKKSRILFMKSDRLSLTNSKKSTIEKVKSCKSYRLKTPKHRLYFWWNSPQLNTINLNLNQPLRSQMNVKNNFNSTFLNFNFNQQEFEKDILIKSSFLLLHICSLFSLLQISQVRSFLQFSFLVATKFVSAYFMIFSLAINRFVNLKTESKIFNSFGTPTDISKKLETSEIETPPNLLLMNQNSSAIPEMNWNQISYKKREFTSSFFGLTPFNEESSNSSELINLTKVSNQNKNLFKGVGTSGKAQIVTIHSETSLVNILLAQSNLLLIRVSKLSIVSSYQVQKFVYSIFSKFLELIEGFLAFIYQFLEKPAEFMIDWIAQLFLIEWSSNLRMVMPDLLENNMWKTFFKLSRNSSIFGLTGILIQRRFLSLAETFASLLTEADTDLIMRQKKGQIFWEIWSEILMKAVDKYNMNLSSLTTLKDEQDRLLQNLINDSNWNWSTSSLQTLIPFLEIQNLNKIQTWDEPKHSQVFAASELKNRSLTVLNEEPLAKLTNFQTFLTGIFKNGSLKNKTQKLLHSSHFIQRQSDSWATYQSITLQARESDLFIEYNPPRTFQNTRIFKHAGSLQPNIGGIVCEIYAGIFSRKVAKNLLVIGPSGREKTWLIQALAGETELKLMIDNAARYAIVQQGVAVGMKLLRDVFEGLALNAPCIFLIEDIHVIGEKRSLLISEDQITSADNLLGTEREEIHEKNQMISQVTRHMMVHYKKPYKGDFSMTIAANRMNFQLFLGVSPPITRHSNLTVENPLPYKDLPGFEQNSGSSLGKNPQFSSTTDWKSESQFQSFASFLQIPKEQKFSPSSISPLSLLMLREQKKLKPKKKVKELSWFGLPSDQANAMSKASYSIRVKVAILADLAISNLSVKLDMITELLVIIDSVRANRGFMIFATTHLPYKLDPALRRPGRLDETLNLGLIPNFKDRLEILKLSIGAINPVSSPNFDRVRENQFFATNMLSNFAFSNSLNFSLTNRISRTFDCFDYSLEFKSLTQSEIQTLVKKTKRLLQPSQQNSKASAMNILENVPQSQQVSLDRQMEKFLTYEITQLFNSKKKFKDHEKTESRLNEAFAYLNSGVLNLNAKIYAKTSQVLFEIQSAQNAESYALKWWNTNSEKYESGASLFEILYSTEKQGDSLKAKNFIYERISILLAKKVGEYLIHSNAKFSSSLTSKLNRSHKNNFDTQNSELKKIHAITPLTLLTIEDKKTGQLSPYSLILSFLQKRANFSQNMMITEFLSFQDKSPFKESPGPVVTSIVSPLQKYENYKRTESDFQVKPLLSIQEKIHLHQHQRFLKNLYQKPIQRVFETLSMSSNSSNNFSSFNTQPTGFHNSIRELGYHDLILSKPTSVNAYYRNRILGRHRSYYLNQWWTGQLPEHNAEMTFSSDVDWRSKFIGTQPSKQSTVSDNSLTQNQGSSSQDIQIDFPDPDQYYNPRSRRWILNSGYWATWNNVSTLMMLNFSSYYLLQNFQKTYNYLSNQREMLDYFSYLFLKYGNLKEIDFLWVRKNSS
jgi:SpoVK/Ycf46/Vps4 family AAA+-type ATPase